jgi:hypothetical protein
MDIGVERHQKSYPTNGVNLTLARSLSSSLAS